MRKSISNIQQQLKGISSFNYAERRGIAVLISLIVIVEAVNAFLPVSHASSEIDLDAFQAEFIQFEKALSQPDTLLKEKLNKKGKPERKYANRQFRTKTAAAKPPMMVEINTADSAGLVRLSGIGPVFADRILKYRGLLGGFYSIEQLLEVYGMDSSRYIQVRDHITIDTALLDTIPVNEATFKDLLRHPYLDFETVKQIVNYRQREGPIINADSLRKLVAYDPMFQKIRPYIKY